MTESLFNIFRGRLRLSPLETFTSWAFLVFLCSTLLQSGEARPPLKVCGHVYARPPSVILVLLLVIAIVAVLIEIIRLCSRLLSLRHLDRMRRTACIMPAATHNQPSCRIALYSSKTALDPIMYVFFGGICMWIVWDVARELNILGISVIILLAVNFFLSIFNRFWPLHGPGWYAFVLKLLTVITTAYDYSDVGLAERDWNPTESEVALTKRNIPFRDFAGGAAFDTEQGSLVVHGSSNIGFLDKKLVSNSWIGQLLYAILGNYQLLGFVRLARVPVVVDKEGGNFRVLSVRLPYVLVWYSIYGLIGAMGGYGGADEIDKCLIWLALVSALAAIFVSIIPGPCIVIPADDENALTEDVVGNTPMEGGASNEGENFDTPNEDATNP